MTDSTEKKLPETRANYLWSTPITTRWMDNDIWGHVNNVVYYSFFDTAANLYLIEAGGFDIQGGNIAGFAVESKCNYREPIAFPDKLTAGVRVDKLGCTSVTYGIAIFREGSELAAASGYFVHVFVDRKTSRPVPIPEKLREALAKILRA